MKKHLHFTKIDPGDRKHRATNYDAGARMGAPESVYSPQCIIALKWEVAACRSCGTVTEIVNHYCAL